MTNEQIDQEETQSLNNQRSKTKEKDILIIIFLILLYTIQGIPMGIATSIPLILSSKKVSYSNQGLYSFATWPFSIRILWSPLIDRFFLKKIGRRKTWVIAAQLFSGIIMITSASFVKSFTDSNSIHMKNDTLYLTIIFGSLIFLTATNDIALDAWSIDLLMEENAAIQSLCNSVGMGVGQFIGNSGFLMFESENFSNKIRKIFKLNEQNKGLITIQDFLYFFGSVSILVSILIFFFKNEYNFKKHDTERLIVEKYENDSKNSSIFDTYKNIWKLFFIKPIRIWLILMITHRFAFSPESVFRIKLIEKGFPKERLSFVNLILSPILTLIPIILARIIKGPKPLNYFRLFFFMKLNMIVIYCLFLFNMSYFQDENNNFYLFFYIILFILDFLNGFFAFAASITLGGFNARISDRLIGGTYMTFLAFWQNTGANMARTSLFFLINSLTFKQCDSNLNNERFSFNNNTNSSNSNSVRNETCRLLFDPYYPIAAVLIFFGMFWLFFTKKYFKYVQSIPKSGWALPSNNN